MGIHGNQLEIVEKLLTQALKTQENWQDLPYLPQIFTINSLKTPIIHNI